MLVLITYDVNTQDKSGKTRLRKVAKECVNHGQRVQNSVFECILDAAQCKLLKVTLLNIINQEKDSLRFYYLGNKYSNKVEHYGAKKKAIGSRIKQAYVKGDYAIIPVQTEIPVQMTTKADSQKSQVDDVQKAVVPWNLITKERYLLIKAGSKIELEVKDVQKRKFLRRNGELRVESTKISTPFNQTTAFPAVLIVNDKIGLGNKIFKFKRIRTTKSEKSYLKLLQDVKVDLTSGLFVNEKL